ncbi:Cytochrome b reductase 1, partial (mitochondrion) [Quillaja saponaria]
MVIGSRTQGCPCFFRVRRGRENAPSQCSSTRRYGAEVTHAILPGKARTTFNKRVPVPETDTGG